MIPVPAGVRVWLATGPHGHEEGVREPGGHRPGDAQTRSERRSSLRLPRPTWPTNRHSAYDFRFATIALSVASACGASSASGSVSSGQGAEVHFHR